MAFQKLKTVEFLKVVQSVTVHEVDELGLGLELIWEEKFIEDESCLVEYFSLKGLRA